MEVPSSVQQETLMASTDDTPYAGGSQSLGMFLVRIQYGGMANTIIRLPRNPD
jgi:hypothetical protein